MIFLTSDDNCINFARKKGSKDRIKRKRSKVGSLKLLSVPGATALGMLSGGLLTAAQLKMGRKPTIVRNIAGGGVLGGIGGYYAGSKLDKKMKTGKYER